MSRKLGIFVSLVILFFLIGFTWNINSKTALAYQKQALTSPTYIEQLAFGEFLNHLNEESPTKLEWNKPLYVQKSKLPKLIRNCKTHLAVNEILAKETAGPVQQENPKPGKSELKNVKTNQQIVNQKQQQVKPKVKKEQQVQPQTSTPQKVIALTFDDGPHKKYNNKNISSCQENIQKSNAKYLKFNIAL